MFKTTSFTFVITALLLGDVDGKNSRILRMNGGKSRNGGKSGKNGEKTCSGKSGSRKGKSATGLFQEGGYQSFTPGPAFFFNKDNSESSFIAYSPNPDVKIQMRNFHNVEGDEGWCSSSVCMGEYLAFTTTGYATSPTQWSTELVMPSLSSIELMCPLPAMTLSITKASCVDGSPATVINTDNEGIWNDGWTYSGCSSTNPYKVEFTCTGTQEAIQFLECLEPEADALGYENRPRSLEAMIFQRDTSAADALWVADYENNFFEQLDTETGDSYSSGCTTVGCVGVVYTTVYIWGRENPNKAVIEDAGKLSSTRLACPRGDQTILVTPLACDGAPWTGLTYNSAGPVAWRFDATSCTGDVVRVQIDCIDPVTTA